MKPWRRPTTKTGERILRSAWKMAALLGVSGWLAFRGAARGAEQLQPPPAMPASPGELPVGNRENNGEGLMEDDEMMTLPDAKLWRVPPEAEAPAGGATRPLVLAQPARPEDVEAAGTRTPSFRLTRDPLLRTSGSQAMGGGELLSDGLGGVAGNLSSPLLPPPSVDNDLGIILGPLRLGVSVGVSAIWQRIEEEGAGTFDNTSLSLSTALNLRLGDPGSGHVISLAYSASVGLNGEGDSGGRSFGVSSSGAGGLGSANGTSTGTGNRGGEFNQQLSLIAAYSFPKLELGLGISFASLTGQNRDVGSRVGRDLLTVSLTSRYPISPKTSVSWDISTPIRQFDGGIDSGGLTSQHFVDYQYSPKTSVGAGVSFGWLKVAEGTNQTFQQVTVRAAHELSGKLQATGSLGYEFRQAGDTSSNTPVFTLGASWTPRLGTTVSLTADRRIFNSATERDVNYSSTSVMLSLSQRVGGRCNLGLGLGWENGDYQALNRQADTAREDNLFFAQATFAVKVSKRFAATAYFAYTDNQSNVASYNTLTAGVQGSFTF